MKRKILCMVFKTDDGETIPALCRDSCVPEQVMAALHFIDCGYKIELSVHEVEPEN